MALSPIIMRLCASYRCVNASLAAAGLLLAAPVSPVLAQEQGASGPENSEYVEGLKACQLVEDDTARLDCFDSAVSNIVTATDSGDLQMVDREDVRQTRRSLFGFSLPDLGIFGGGDDEEEEERFTTTIASVRYTGRRSARITTAEGAVWEMNNIPTRRRTFQAGDTVVFKPASLGYYFLRIGGQTGVKGRRIR